MIESQTELLIRVRFRVVLVDPAREAGANESWVLGDGDPVGVVFDLRVDKGHLLRAGDALIPVKHLALLINSAGNNCVGGKRSVPRLAKLRLD